MRHIAAIIAALLITASAGAAAVEDSLLPMQLNGAVVGLYDYRHPERSVNVFGRKSGNPLDNFPATGFDSSNASFSASLGAALGTGAFGNQVVGTIDKGRNSDRAFSIFLPQKGRLPLNLGVYHRKIDSRSDINHWVFSYRKALLGDTLLNEHEAMTDETGASLGFRRGLFSSSVRAETYGRWEASAFPYYTKGYAVTADIGATLTEGDMHLTAVVDRHRDYILAKNRAKEYTDEKITATLNRRVGKGAMVTADGEYNSRLESSGHIGLALADTTAQSSDWQIYGAVFGDGHPDAGVAITLRLPTKRFALATIIDAEYGYLPAERQVACFAYVDTVKSGGIGASFQTAGGTLRLNDTILSRLHPLPVMVELFGHYTNAPLFEVIGRDGWNQQTTTTGTATGAKKINAGGRMTIDSRWKYVDAHIRGIAIVNTPNQPQFVKLGEEHTNAVLDLIPYAVRKPLSSIGKVMGATLSLHGALDTTFRIGVTYEYRDAIAMAFPSDEYPGVYSTIVGSKSNTVSFNARIPFPFPFPNCSLKPEFRGSAGPFSLDKENPRAVQYPGGEWIGPYVKLAIAGQF